MSGRFPLAGKTCVITGAGSGIGRALAEKLSAQGCPVAICDWNEEGLRETANGLDGEVFSHRVDVRDATAVKAFTAEVVKWAPAPFGMIANNAGVTVSQLAAEAAVEDDEWVLDVNFHGVVNGTRAWLPILLEQGSGAVVNTSSIFGLMGWPAQSMYCASKHAVRGYTEAVRHELRGTGVRAIIVHPGGIKTNIVRNARFHKDDKGRTERGDLEKEFDAVTLTTPEKAAKIIVDGVEHGKARILVGPDAHMISGLVRLSPSRYFDVVALIQPLLRRAR